MVKGSKRQVISKLVHQTIEIQLIFLKWPKLLQLHHVSLPMLAADRPRPRLVEADSLEEAHLLHFHASASEALPK
jgi:hypothetical protein